MSDKAKRVRFFFDVDAWLSSTAIAAMSADQERAYLRLLLHAWKQDDCGLPNDEEMLAALSLLGDRWSVVGSRVRAQFVERNGRLYNERLLEEWGYQQEFHAKAKQKSVKAIEALRDRRESAPVAGAVPSHTPSSASRTPPSRPSSLPSSTASRCQIANSEKRIAAKAAANTREREDSPPPLETDRSELATLAEAMQGCMGRGAPPPDVPIVRQVLDRAGGLDAALAVCGQLRCRADRPRSYALFATVAASRPVAIPPATVLEMPRLCADCHGTGWVRPSPEEWPLGMNGTSTLVLVDWIEARSRPCSCRVSPAAATG